MKLELPLLTSFGAHLSDGYEAADFRRKEVDPYVDFAEAIVFDFTGVRTANSSFVNALVSGLVEQHGTLIVDKVVFKGCSPVIRVLVRAAIELGMQKIAGRVDA